MLLQTQTKMVEDRAIFTMAD